LAIDPPLVCSLFAGAKISASLKSAPLLVTNDVTVLVYFAAALYGVHVDYDTGPKRPVGLQFT
jgi:hypothetical protein